MIEQPFRAAIVGCGRIAGLHQSPASGAVESHAQAFHANASTVLVGACEPDPTRRTRFAASWQVPVFEDMETLLHSTHPEIVSVASPPRQHYEQIAALVKHPLAPRVVFAEKPVCVEPEELEALQQIAAAGRSEIVVNHTRRFDPAHRQAAAAIESGEFGRLLGGRADYYGGWVQNGTHLVDVLRMLLGDVTVVEAAPGVSGRPGDDCQSVRLRAQGADIRADGVDESFYQLFEIDLRFERARLLFEDFGARVRIQRASVNTIGEQVLHPELETRLDGLVEPLRHAVDAIVNALAVGTPLADTGASLTEAARTMRVVWQARTECRC